MSDYPTIDALSPLRDVIRDHELRAEKSLGQNFLLDLNLTAKIVRTAKFLENKTVFEIGPGPGGLTRALLKTKAKNVIALEYDPRAIDALQTLVQASDKRLILEKRDALATDLLALAQKHSLQGPYVIVANLPYNIATPLLTNWLAQIHADQNHYAEMVLMFQKEVAQRIVANPSSKNYGRLSIISQWLCDCKIAFDVPAAAFTPPPKVTSSIVRFVPKERPEVLPDFSIMEKLTAAAFGQRRKMIRSSLKEYLLFVEQCGIRPEARAEELSVDDYARLAKAVAEN